MSESQNCSKSQDPHRYYSCCMGLVGIHIQGWLLQRSGICHKGKQLPTTCP